MTARRLLSAVALAASAVAAGSVPVAAHEHVGPECSAPTRYVNDNVVAVGLSYGPIAVVDAKQVDLQCFLLRGDSVLLAAESSTAGSVGFAAGPGVISAKRFEELLLCRSATWTRVDGTRGETLPECWPIVVV